jgi:predicted nucleic acid-binding Zn ribbon protein
MARYAGDEPVPLSDALAKVGKELGLAPGDAHHTLDARWSEVVGNDVAAHARLVSVRDGTLTVAVDDPIWATQLRYLEPAIVTRATALLGPGIVTGMKVRVGREHAS